MAQTGLCVLDVCAQGQGACSNNAKVTCNPVGDGYGSPQACGDKSTCVAPNGKPECKAWVCTPGKGCDGDKAVTCSDDGLTVVGSVDCAKDGKQCAAGVCKAIDKCKPGGCDDGNPCTDDSCDVAKGCLYVANTKPCDDGDACTEGDKCLVETCVAGKKKVCDDGNPCTTDSCDKAKGCQAAAVKDETSCSQDGSKWCQAGKCEVKAVCGNKVKEPGEECDDGNASTYDGCLPSCVIPKACAVAQQCDPKGTFLSYSTASVKSVTVPVSATGGKVSSYGHHITPTTNGIWLSPGYSNFDLLHFAPKASGEWDISGSLVMKSLGTSFSFCGTQDSKCPKFIESVARSSKSGAVAVGTRLSSGKKNPTFAIFKGDTLGAQQPLAIISPGVGGSTCYGSKPVVGWSGDKLLLGYGGFETPSYTVCKAEIAIYDSVNGVFSKVQTITPPKTPAGLYALDDTRWVVPACAGTYCHIFYFYEMKNGSLVEVAQHTTTDYVTGIFGGRLFSFGNSKTTIPITIFDLTAWPKLGTGYKPTPPYLAGFSARVTADGDILTLAAAASIKQSALFIFERLTPTTDKFVAEATLNHQVFSLATREGGQIFVGAANAKDGLTGTGGFSVVSPTPLCSAGGACACKPGYSGLDCGKKGP